MLKFCNGIACPEYDSNANFAYYNFMVYVHEL
jgi:hypothetical protein